MSELTEVFEMTTKQVEPDLDAWREQEQRQRGARRKRRLGALVVGVAASAALVTGVILVANGRSGTERTTRPGGGSEQVTGATTEPPVPAVGPVPETDYLLDLTTGEMTPLPESFPGTQQDEAGDYAVSPDGSRLAYSALGDNGRSQIYVANLDGTGIEQVTHDLEAAFSPAWSPDGAKIAYTGHGGDDPNNLFVLDLATGTSMQLTFEAWEPDPAPPGYGWKASEPSFTPDGSFIVYGVDRFDAGLGRDEGEYEVRIVPIAGGASVRLMSGSSVNAPAGTDGIGSPQLSPDGSLLSHSCGYFALCIANADGTGAQVLAQSGDAMIGSDWSPDGTRISYSTLHGYDVLIVDVATGQATYVADGWAETWLDDHTLIVEINDCYDPSTEARSRSCAG